MELSKNGKVIIIGLGLIGGCYARALKKQGFRVYAIDQREEAIRYAVREHIIDDGWCEVNEDAVSGADVVVFSLYPHVFLKWIEEHGSSLHKGQLITDVTGVKRSVVYEVQRLLGDRAEFIAAHPMAGREVYGVENSDERIFNGANYIVVPTENNTTDAVEACKTLGSLLGFSRVSVLTPEEHDDMIGFLSQLPHCIAVCLMTCSDNHNLVRYTGDSFRDLTRIARINENMWTELFLMNKDALLNQMDRFLADFTSFRNMLAADDAEGMKDRMRISTERRAWFDNK